MLVKEGVYKMFFISSSLQIYIKVYVKVNSSFSRSAWVVAGFLVFLYLIWI